MILLGATRISRGHLRGFDWGATRISRRHLHGFWLGRKEFQEGSCKDLIGARRVSRGPLYGFDLSLSVSVKRLLCINSLKHNII